MSKQARKQLKNTIGDIKWLISLAKNSVKIAQISIEEDDGMHNLRPQMHIMLRSSTGSLKSTILRFIQVASNGFFVDSTTAPGMVGTIDKTTFQMIPGASWKGRNNILLFDEFNFRRKTTDSVVFLKLLEDQTYVKRFGLFSSAQELKDKDLYFRVDKGLVEVKTRFSAVIATMRRFEYFSSANFKALVNRCIPYEYSFNLDELDYLISKTKLFTVSRYKTKDSYIVKNRDYKRIKKAVKKLMPDNDVGKENFTRAVGDAVRAHCIMGNCKKSYIEKICKWKIDTYSKIGKYYEKRGEKK